MLEELVNKEQYHIEFENLTPADQPILITRPEFMRRMKEMSIIISALELYAREHQGVFPESLDVLSKQKYLTKVYADPVTAKPYKYVFDSEGNYSVCTYVVDYTLKCLFTSSRKIGF